jgi:16S rRNA processing protein RimM
MERTSGSTSSTEQRPDQIPVGRVVGAHGLRGQLRVRCFGDAPEALAHATRLTLGGEEGEAPGRSYEVASLAPGRRGELRIGLVGVRSRDAAEALRGRQVWMAAQELQELPEGEYYGYQIVGCRIEGEDGTLVGTVREVWSTGGPDVLVVEGEGRHEHLVPAALLREVDVEGRRAVIELLPGLLEAE